MLSWGKRDKSQGPGSNQWRVKSSVHLGPCGLPLSINMKQPESLGPEQSRKNEREREREREKITRVSGPAFLMIYSPGSHWFQAAVLISQVVHRENASRCQADVLVLLCEEDTFSLSLGSPPSPTLPPTNSHQTRTCL